MHACTYLVYATGSAGRHAREETHTHAGVGRMWLDPLTVVVTVVFLMRQKCTCLYKCPSYIRSFLIDDWSNRQCLIVSSYFKWFLIELKSVLLKRKVREGTHLRA